MRGPKSTHQILGPIFRSQITGAANIARIALNTNPAGTAFIILGGAFLAAYQLASLYVDIAQLADPIRRHWPRIVQTTTVLALPAGYAIGARLTAQAARVATAPWLAVLPWSERAQRRAISQAAIWSCAPLASAFLGSAWMAGLAATAPRPLLSACAPTAAFASAYAAATARKLRSAINPAQERPRHHSTRGPAWPPALLLRLDQQRPSWAGTWAINPSASRPALWWIISLLLAAGIAACITLVQHWPWPSLIVGIIGGHIAFLATLRAAPLLSPVLRAAPLGFATAWAAMLRLPTALSLCGLVCAAPPALAASPTAWQSIPGVTLSLLLLNALFAACLATTPGSRRQAFVLHTLGLTVIIQQAAEYGLAYGALAAMLIFALSAFLVRKARRRYRANG